MLFGIDLIMFFVSAVDGLKVIYVKKMRRWWHLLAVILLTCSIIGVNAIKEVLLHSCHVTSKEFEVHSRCQLIEMGFSLCLAFTRSIFLGLTLSYSPSLNRRPFNSIVVAHMQTQLKMLGSVLVHHHLHHHHQFNLLTSSAVSPLHRLFQRSLTTLLSSTTVHTSIITFYSYLLYFLNRWFKFDSSCVFLEILFGLVSQQSKECEQRIR